jgi:hypothetical protein
MQGCWNVDIYKLKVHKGENHNKILIFAMGEHCELGAKIV